MILVKNSLYSQDSDHDGKQASITIKFFQGMMYCLQGYSKKVV